MQKQCQSPLPIYFLVIEETPRPVSMESDISQGSIKVASLLGHKELVYGDLDSSTKESILTELLVKSAITHAIRKQKVSLMRRPCLFFFWKIDKHDISIYVDGCMMIFAENISKMVTETSVHAGCARAYSVCTQGKYQKSEKLGVILRSFFL